MSFTIGLLIGLAALIILLSIPELAARIRRRRSTHGHHPAASRTEQCEICGAEISIVVTHLVTTTFTDDDTIIGGTGGTAMSAAYCTNHCPGGCTKGCASDPHGSLAGRTTPEG